MFPRKSCRLCNAEAKTGIEIYGRQGVKLSITKILRQHFSLQFGEDDSLSRIICKKCWKITDQFHNLYCTVQEIETALKIIEIKDDLLHVEPLYNYDIKQEIGSKTDNTPGLIPADVSSEYLLRNVKIEDLLNSEYITEPFPNDNKNSILKRISTNRVKRIPKRVKRDVRTQPTTVTVKKNFSTKEELIEQDEKINRELEMICEICNEKCTSFTNLKIHIRSAHSVKGYIRCCGKKFSRRGEICAHILDHNSFGKYKCDTCDKIYIDKARFDRHNALHDPNSKKHLCNICSKRFLSPSALNDHLISVHRTSDATKSFICDICGKAFITKKWLGSHMVSHTQKYHQICDICARVFNSRKLLDEHYKTKHMGIPLPKQQCTICGRWLSNNSGLKRHMLVHNAKQETCKICGKVTANSNSLNTHIRSMHSGRTFQCKICMKVLKSSKSLKEHNASHTGIFLYKCPFCSMEFNSNANMSKHKKNMHPIEYQRKVN